jgi:CheY-like chemotaxis protein
MKSPPDILISDIGLPGMDGYSLIQHLRRSTDPRLARLPAIALTAFARVEDRAEALQAGYQAHLIKPVEPAELIAAIASLAGLVVQKQP